MKQIFAIAAATLLSISSQAAPPNLTHVASNAKWMLHLDIDQLRTTQVGQFLFNEVLQKKITEAKANSTIPFDVPLDKIHAVTGYGTTYENKANGVLLLQIAPELRKVVEGFLVQQANVTDVPEPPVKRTQHDGTIVYEINRQIHALVHSDYPVLLSKSRADLLDAHRVLLGKSDNLKQSSPFAGYPASENQFFFLALAEGFNQSLAIPPQAGILKQSDGGRIVVGETGDQLFANLTLKAKSAEASTQMRQVAEGLIALVSMTQSQNPDLMKLATSAKVTETNQMMQLTIHLPVQSVIEKIEDSNITIRGATQPDEQEPEQAPEKTAPEPSTPEAPSKPSE